MNENCDQKRRFCELITNHPANVPTGGNVGLSPKTVDALISEYKRALSNFEILEKRDGKLALQVEEIVDDMRDNKKQITSLRAILKANDVDTKNL